jgi:hypothetical protein
VGAAEASHGQPSNTKYRFHPLIIKLKQTKGARLRLPKCTQHGIRTS